MSGSNPHSLHWRLVRQAQPYWLHLSGIFLLSLLSSPFALLGPLPLKIAVDSVLDQRPLPRFLQAWVPHALSQSTGSALAVAISSMVALTVLTQLRAFADA